MTTKSILSSSFVSIIISMCLLVNLFAPGFSTVVHNKSTALHPESHTCECNPELHRISSCCCAIDINVSEGESLPQENYQGIFSTFIQSLGCTGLPGQSTSFAYNVSLPEEDISSPVLSLLYHMERLHTDFPVSIKNSPPYKPPRII